MWKRCSSGREVGVYLVLAAQLLNDICLRHECFPDSFILRELALSVGEAISNVRLYETPLLAYSRGGPPP